MGHPPHHVRSVGARMVKQETKVQMRQEQGKAFSINGLCSLP